MKQYEWNRYEEKKPDKDGKYIVLNNTGKMVMKYYLTGRANIGADGFGYTHCHKQYKSACVYWMELPELPDGFLEEMAESGSSSELALKAEIKRLRERIEELENAKCETA